MAHRSAMHRRSMRALRCAVGSPATAMGILLMAGLNIGLLLAPLFLTLLGLPAPPDVLNARRHPDVIRDGAVAHIAIASALAAGLNRPSMRLWLWSGAATLLGIEAASIGAATPVLGGLAPLIGSTLLALWAFGRSRLVSIDEADRTPARHDVHTIRSGPTAAQDRRSG